MSKRIRIVVLVYKLIQNFPKEEVYVLTSQIKRASVSIPSNIVEGFGCKQTNHSVIFLNVSRSFLSELETHLILAKELEFNLDEKVFTEIMLLIEEESKMIHSFSKKLKE